MTSIDGVLKRLETDPSIRAGVLISGKPDNFIAGADIAMLVRGFRRPLLVRRCGDLRGSVWWTPLPVLPLLVLILCRCVAIAGRRDVCGRTDEAVPGRASGDGPPGQVQAPACRRHQRRVHGRWPGSRSGLVRHFCCFCLLVVVCCLLFVVCCCCCCCCSSSSSSSSSPHSPSACSAATTASRRPPPRPF